jgi:hypothetical protein
VTRHVCLDGLFHRRNFFNFFNLVDNGTAAENEREGQ